MMNRAKLKPCLSILILLGIWLMQGCGFLESDQEKAERYYQSGIAALEAKKTEEAQIHFQNALQKNPYHAKAHFRLGTIYIEKDQLFLAVRELGTAVQQDPELREAKRTLAILSYRSEVYEQTDLLCKELIEKWGDDLEILILWGDALLRLNRAPESKVVMERAESAYPDDANIKILLAKVFLAEKQPEEARKKMEAAAALGQSEISVQIALARFYETTATLQEAEGKYLNVCRDFPQNPPAFLTAAQFYLRINRSDEAEGMVRQAFDANLKDPGLHQTMAQIHHRRKNYASALDSLKAAVSESDQTSEQRYLILLADYHLFLKDVPMALEVYEKMLRKWPQLVVIKTKIAELLLAEKRYEEAQQNIEKILAQHSDNAGGHLLQGLLRLKDGQVSEARKEFFISRNLSPETADTRYFYGLTFLMEQDYKISLSEMLAALDHKPDSWPARMGLAYIYFKTERFSLALDILEKLVSEQPENYRTRSLRAAVYERIGNFSRAAADYRQIIEANPDLPELPLFRFRLAETFRVQGKRDEALNEFAAILDSYPEPIRPLEKIIRIHLTEGRAEKALTISDEYLKKDPENLEANLLKARLLVEHGTYEAADGFLAELMKKNPGSERTAFLMGRLNQVQGRFDESVKMFQKVLQINPDHAEGHMALASVYQKTDDLQKAVETYENLLKKGFSIPAANDLAYLYANLDQKLDRALELAAKAQEALPRSPDVADTLGWVHLKRKSPAIAKKYLQEALQARPDDPLFQYHMARVEYEENDFKNALHRMQSALKSGLPKNESDSALKIIEEAEAVESRMKAAEDYARNGEADRAMGIYEELMSLKGFYAPPAMALARLYATKGEHLDRALDLAEKARSRSPDKAAAADTVGWVLLRKGSYLLAKKHFHEAIQAEPKVPDFHYHLGIALHRQKDFEEAEKELLAAIQLGLAEESRIDAEKMLKDR